MRRLTAVALALVVLASGCEDPYEETTKAERDRITADGGGNGGFQLPPADGELTGTVPKELRPPEPARFPTAGRTPRRTLAIAAALYGNWTSDTAARQFSRIAAISVREARAQLRESAAQARVDPQQTGARARARVVAIDIEGAGTRRRAVVVTRERVHARGIADEGPRYRVTLAQVVRRGGRWVISRWTPQP